MRNKIVIVGVADLAGEYPAAETLVIFDTDVSSYFVEAPSTMNELVSQCKYIGHTVVPA